MVNEALHPDNADERAPHLVIDGTIYDRLPFRRADEGLDEDALCVDCDAEDGQIHELGCDAETCPKCGEQLIGCGHVTDPHDQE